MKKENKKILSLIIVVIIVASAMTVSVTYALKSLEEKEKMLPLTVKIFADVSEGVVPHAVNLSSIVTNYEGKVEYYWDFGNGNESEERNPATVYTKNGTFRCNLTIKDDSGYTASDSIEIYSKANSPPTVSIEAPTDKPRRPKNLIIEYLLEKIIHVENYGSQDYRALRDMGLLDLLFRGQESFFTIEAKASDPDGDEIVSYDWTLKAPSYTTRIGKKPVDPEYHYSGKRIDILTKDIYPAKPYSLTLTVTDAAGQKRSENFKFDVLKSQNKESVESFVKTLQAQKTKWVSEWHSNIIIGGIVLGVAALLFKLGYILPAAVSLPAVKLACMIFAKVILQTDPIEYTDETVYDVVERIVYKPRLMNLFLKPFDTNFSDLCKKLLDKTEDLLEKISEAEWLEQNTPGLAGMFKGLSLQLQFIEEQIGLDNKRPILSKPFPEKDDTFVDIDLQKVFITVEDPEGDSFNITISGDYVNNVTYNNQTDGTFNATLMALPQNEDIKWNVLVVDEYGKIVSDTYKFTTVYE